MGIPAPVLKLFWKNTERGDLKRLATQSAPAGVTEICDIPYIDDDKWQHKLAKTKKKLGCAHTFSATASALQMMQ